MMDSHRSYSLVRSIMFHVTGIMALCTLLIFNIYQKEIGSISEELESTAYNLLGYIEYNNGNFMITEANKSESEIFMDKRNLRQSGKARFTYIWDIQQQKIIWNPWDNHSVNRETAEANFVLFDFEAILSDVSLPHGLSIPQAKTMDSVPLESGAKPEQYLVVAENFNFLINEERESYLFIVASSMPSIKHAILSYFTYFTGLLYLIVLLGLGVIVFFKIKNNTGNTKRINNNELTA